MCFSVLVASTGWAQEHEHAHTSDEDSCLTLNKIIKSGHTEVHVRNAFMGTLNEGSLNDYFANASGGSLAYHTGDCKGFSIGVKGIFSYNLYDNGLTRTDPISGKSARWEAELFDVNRPGEKKDLDRLEELFLQYSSRKLLIKAGKIDINKGPLLLRRDGRMKPFVYRGAYAEVAVGKHAKAIGLYINGVSPRGMTEWYNLNEAIGISNNGFHYDGSSAHYHERLNTMGIFGLAIEGEKKNLSYKLWNYHFENIMNTLWLEGNFKHKKWEFGLQTVNQMPSTGQNNLESNERYMRPDEDTWVVSGQIKWNHDKLSASAAYLHSFSNGRFLFPKELGREDFFVSHSRTWVDGFANLNVYQLRLEGKIKKHWSYDVRMSYWDGPGIYAFSHNKYGKPDFYQWYSSLVYHFRDQWDGLTTELLFVSRRSEAGALPVSKMFYQTNFQHFNFIVNYTITI